MFHTSSSFWWIPAFLVYCNITPISASIYTCISFLCYYVSFSVSNKNNLIRFRVHSNPVLSHLNLCLNYICQDPIIVLGRHRFWGDTIQLTKTFIFFYNIRGEMAKILCMDAVKVKIMPKQLRCMILQALLTEYLMLTNYPGNRDSHQTSSSFLFFTVIWKRLVSLWLGHRRRSSVALKL